MKKHYCVRFIIAMLLVATIMFSVTACTVDASAAGSKMDISNTADVANTLQANQPTPTDISYSLERYNLIRRTYWVNGQREKANALVCEIEKPLGYIVLFSGNTADMGTIQRCR